MRIALAVVAALLGLLGGVIASWPAAEPLERWLEARDGLPADCPAFPEQEARAKALQEAIRSSQRESP